MKISLNIPDKRVTELLHGHVMNSSPWLHRLTGQWNHKRGANVYYDRETDDEGSNTGRMRVGRKAVARGLILLAEADPVAFGAILDDDGGDSVGCDSAWQCIIFGKLVYG